MYKGIGLVIALVGTSLLTSGIYSAVLDLIAFVVLVYMALNHKQYHRGKQTKEQEAHLAFNVKKQRNDKLDITP